MRINGIPGEVARVTSFSQVRAGAIVWDAHCEVCSGIHRYFVVGLKFDEFVDAEDVDKDVDGRWDVEWQMTPDPHDSEDIYFNQFSFDEGNFYIQVDPLLDAATTARKREAVRT